MINYMVSKEKEKALSAIEKAPISFPEWFAGLDGKITFVQTSAVDPGA